MIQDSRIKFAFFGSSQFSIYVLNELEKADFIPALIVTTPDKPQGRSLKIQPNIVKSWAIQKQISVLDPAKLDENIVSKLKEAACDVFIVASYGKIIPEAGLEMPERKTLNIHPSLLPKYRGASPLQSAMLDDVKNTGVSIMKIDKEMDHGPIVAQKSIQINEWPIYEEFEEHMAKAGAELLAMTLPGWVEGKVPEKEQDHSQATFTKKISKEDALLDLAGDPYLNFRKIQAYHEWPQAYFMHKNIRVKVTQALFKDGKLSIEKVIPEGKKEISWKDFVSGYGDPTH